MSLKKPEYAYHSFCWDEEPAEPCQSVTFDRGEAFVHDIHNGLPAQFERADVVYVEPPWKMGHTTFNKRLGIESSDWNKFTAAISAAILSTQKPFLLLCSPAAVDKFPTPTHSEAIKVYGLRAQMQIYRMERPDIFGKRKLPDNLELIRWLAQRYNSVADFCCGYGVTGRLFVEAGKSCILADYNPRCIGHIKAHNHEWKR
jgi:hypothetical protein